MFDFTPLADKKVTAIRPNTRFIEVPVRQAVPEKKEFCTGVVIEFADGTQLNIEAGNISTVYYGWGDERDLLVPNPILKVALVQ